MLTFLQGWLRIYDEEIAAESIASRIRPRNDATGVGPRGIETLATVTAEYRTSATTQNASSQRFSDYPEDFGPQITSIVKESLSSHSDPASFAVLLVSFITASSVLSDDFLDTDIAEVLKFECSNVYVAACVAREPSTSSVFLSTFDIFLAHKRALASALSPETTSDSQMAQNVHLVELILFKCAVSFLESLIARMKKESVALELATVIRLTFVLCSDRSMSDDIKTSKLKPMMKVLRTCFSKLGSGQKSQEVELGRECLLAALTSFALENLKIADFQTYDSKIKLLSYANEWMAIARDCSLDIFKDDEAFQPKFFESTHPYADNRMSPPPPSTFPPLASFLYLCSDSSFILFQLTQSSQLNSRMRLS